MDLSLDTFEAAARSTGVPEFVIEAVTGASEAARSGKYSRATDDVVQRVLGRRGSTFEHWLVRHQDAFRVGRWPHRST
jgi:hypothetical protein